MKRFSINSLLFCLFIIFSLHETAKAANTYNGYKTYTMKDAKILSKLPNSSGKVSGVTYSTTSVQGMNVGTTYIYNAKIYSGNQNVNVATIFRTTIDKGVTEEMEYYSSLSASSPSTCTTAGHANDLLVVTASDVNYLLAATCESEHAVSRYMIKGKKLYFTGYFKLVTTGGKAISCSSLRQYKHASGYFHLIFKTGESVYYGKVLDSATGNKNNPTEIKVFKIAILDKRNAVFAKSSSSYGTYANMETWVPQGFGFNPLEKTIYTPYFEPPINSGITTTAIITYYIGNVFTDANMDYKKDRSIIVLPTKTSFYLKSSDFNPKCKSLEVESCGFRTGQDTTGDLKMYLNANASPMDYEAVYYLSYKSGSGNFAPIADSSTPIYTVHYDANGGTDTGTNSVSGYFRMDDTRHVRGITTNLRKNYFARKGYTFKGWYLSRKSDGKWLYLVDGNTLWYEKDKQPSGSSLALYADRRAVSMLSSVNGDVVTCHAQWKAN